MVGKFVCDRVGVAISTLGGEEIVAKEKIDVLSAYTVLAKGRKCPAKSRLYPKIRGWRRAVIHNFYLVESLLALHSIRKNAIAIPECCPNAIKLILTCIKSNGDAEIIAAAPKCSVPGQKDRR